MKKSLFLLTLLVLGVWFYRDYTKSKRIAEANKQKEELLEKLGEIEDNLHGYSKNDTTYFAYSTGEVKIYFSNKKYVIKKNIDGNRMIIYDGCGMCYIGVIKLEKNKYPTFRTQISFRNKPLVSDGYVLDDDNDINSLIKELNSAKNAYIKFHNITIKNGITSHYETFITGNPPKFGLGSDYECDNGIDCVVTKNVGGELKFESVNEIDNMIQILNDFKKNKFINVDELYT